MTCVRCHARSPLNCGTSARGPSHAFIVWMPNPIKPLFGPFRCETNAVSLGPSKGYERIALRFGVLPCELDAPNQPIRIPHTFEQPQPRYPAGTGSNMSDAPIVLACASPYSTSMEDRHVCDSKVPFFAVLDGESEGGVAAQIAVDTLLEQRARLFEADTGTVGVLFDEALQLANRRIFEQARQARSNIGGTTCTACTIVQGTIVVAHIGDSRLYVARDRTWHRVTLDHTLREDIDARAGLAGSDLVAETLTNVVTRVLGVIERVRVDLYTIPLQGNVALLLCTDGAWRPVDPLGAPGGMPFDDDLQLVGDTIMQRRRLDGARDDATVLIARCGAAG